VVLSDGTGALWVYDRSPDERRPRELLEKSVKVVVLLLKLSNLPRMNPARKSGLNIISILES
jgi:hypothetical protein